MDHIRTFRVIAATGVVMLTGFTASAADLHQSIVYSKHNLSISGPGSIKAGSEAQVCIFCHTPHQASGQAPLWNRFDSGQVYQTYTSSTSKALIGQPTGASKLCLSCHDGTVALGMIRSRLTSVSLAGGVTRLPAGRSNLGTDLSNDHPVSFPYDSSLVLQNPQLKNPSTLVGNVHLDTRGEMQCTSCHDPHHNDNGNFLNEDDRYGNLCVQCHTMTGWDQSSHRTSTAVWNSRPPDPWPYTDRNNVAENGCGNCHRPHTAEGGQRLLTAAKAEDVCLNCHRGNTASKNVYDPFFKGSVHPVINGGTLHDAAEPVSMGTNRHVTCVDCHNPHAVDQTDASVPGALRGVRGIDRNGAEIAQVNHEYELCFRCHGDSNHNRKYVPRVEAQPNVRLAFDPSNMSYHPVISPGRNPDVPSLIASYTTTSVISCTDCHNNDQAANPGSSVPKGPHGSNYAPLLEKQLVVDDITFESSQAYALCYKCHSRTSILNDESFPLHNFHIVVSKASCSVCHDAHGVQGSAHLVNFNRFVVVPNRFGMFGFRDNGKFAGTCSLKCHNEDHDQWSYSEGSFDEN